MYTWTHVATLAFRLINAFWARPLQFAFQEWEPRVAGGHKQHNARPHNRTRTTTTRANQQEQQELSRENGEKEQVTGNGEQWTGNGNRESAIWLLLLLLLVVYSLCGLNWSVAGRNPPKVSYRIGQMACGAWQLP